MFLLTRRQARTAMAATAGAAAYLAASEIGARKLRLSGLWILSSAAMAGMASVSGTAKARAAHKRIDILVPQVAGKFDKTGGTVSGSVTVTGSHIVQGNHTVQGTLFGSGGSVSLGDHIDLQNNNLTRVHVLSVADGDANIYTAGGGFGVSGNFNLQNNNIVNGGNVNGVDLTFSSTTGQPNLNPAPATYQQGSFQGAVNRINSILDAIG